ncbi:IS3 family transposase [Anaerotignum sp.]
MEKFFEFYNEKRFKEKLGCMSPLQYRLGLLQHKRKRRSGKSTPL